MRPLDLISQESLERVVSPCEPDRERWELLKARQVLLTRR